MLIKDSHAHIYLSDFADDIEEILNRASEEGVKEIYMPNIDSTSIDDMHSIEERFPNCKSMMGLHPCYVKENYKEELAIIEKHLNSRKYAAVGEIGIDLYWDKTFVEAQFESFEYQIALAKEHKLAVNIHSRDALDHTIEIMSKHQDGNMKAIFHCFNGTVKQGKKIVDQGYFMGIGGVVTYKNAGVGEVVSQLPLENMVIETDSPYLSPGPKRVKRNEPSRISLIMDKLEVLYDLNRSEIAKVTSNNCEKVYTY